MIIQFTKMHGLGNDFMVIDGIRQSIQLTPGDIQALAKRDTGIGFDQCLLVEKSQDANIDFFYRIFNADGQEVGQCGNGARCLARFVVHHQLTDKRIIRVATKTTNMQLMLNADDSVTVSMAIPTLSPKDIPLNMPQEAPEYTLDLPDHTRCHFHAINVGNPHAVLIVDDLTTAPVETLGRFISEHELFPEQTNTGFMQIIDQSHIQLRVYERGCGETQACGSGAVAAAAIGRLYHGLANTILVRLPGGELQISWPDLNGPISLTGPACFVYEGTVRNGRD